MNSKTKSKTPKKKWSFKNLANKKNVNTLPKQHKSSASNTKQDDKKHFPDKFPFWARLKIEKKRPALIIDEEKAYNKNKKRMEEGFVHREVTHSKKQSYLSVIPNPDKSDKKPMYLKNPKKKPKIMFKPLEENWTIPENIEKMYDKNNNKKKK